MRPSSCACGRARQLPPTRALTAAAIARASKAVSASCSVEGAVAAAAVAADALAGGGGGGGGDSVRGGASTVVARGAACRVP